MNVVLPARGEFGLKLRYHVPAVHALAGPKVVFHESGEECLFPSADELFEVPSVEDKVRRGTFPKGDQSAMGDLRAAAQGHYPGANIIQTRAGMPEARFIPQPHVEQRVGPVDIVVCPRKRAYGSAKNWPFWEWLTYDFADRGLKVFAAGAPDSSESVECRRAWDYARFLDASVEAICSARLVVATDAGLAHLAVLCGTPLLLITHRGRVAPGPVLDDVGHAMKPSYWPVRVDDYYRAANHTGSPIIISHAWEFRKLVRDEALDAFHGMAAA